MPSRGSAAQSRPLTPAWARSRSPAQAVSTGSIAEYPSGSRGRPRWVLRTSAWVALGSSDDCHARDRVAAGEHRQREDVGGQRGGEAGHVVVAAAAGEARATGIRSRRRAGWRRSGERRPKLRRRGGTAVRSRRRPARTVGHARIGCSRGRTGPGRSGDAVRAGDGQVQADRAAEGRYAAGGWPDRPRRPGKPAGQRDRGFVRHAPSRTRHLTDREPIRLEQCATCCQPPGPCDAYYR